MPKWEYRIEWINTLGCYLMDKERYPTDGALRAELMLQARWEPINDLGTLGWELASASFQGDEGIAVFKRELKESHPKLVAPPAEEPELTEDGEPAKAREGLDKMVRRFRNG